MLKADRDGMPQAHQELCQPPFSEYDDPAYSLPPGACDTHAHVVSSSARYPFVNERSYTPPPAPEKEYIRMLDGTGMSRGVLVQISVYGTDNRYMLSVLRKHPVRLRGVAVVDADIADAELATMHKQGVRGVRLNVLFGGGVGLEALEELAAKVAQFGWHLQLLLDARDLPELLPRLTRLPVPVVIDHMGHLPAELGTEHPGFQALLTLIGEHKTWVKLSGAYRIDAKSPEYPAAARFAESLMAAAPERMLYGGDWPHVAVPYAMPNTGHLRNLLGEWIEDEKLRRKVLVDNPALLYGFETTT